MPTSDRPANATGGCQRTRRPGSGSAAGRIRGMGRIPLASIRGSSPAATEALQLLLYLTEVERQAKIATRAFERAWLGAMRPADQQDTEAIWADLQACLFASIIVERVLLPREGAIRSYPKATRNRRVAQALKRGGQLRKLLELPDAEVEWLRVSAVRDPLEHFDERLDNVILDEVVSVSDRYVSRGLIGQTVTHDAMTTRLLRVFVAPAGLLFYDDQPLDLYALDHVLLETLGVMADARDQLHESGGPPVRPVFGSQRPVYIAPEKATKRMKLFIEHHAELGAPLDVKPAELYIDAPSIEQN